MIDVITEMSSIILYEILIVLLTASALALLYKIYDKFILKIEGGPSGLRNVAGTCYLNAMFQALAASEKLVQSYKDLLWDEAIPELKQFVDLLQSINERGNNDEALLYNSKCFKELTDAVEWDRESQKDAFYMLSFFIDILQNNLKTILEEKKKCMPPKIKLLHVFCENSFFNKLQDHLALDLPLASRNQSLFKLAKKYVDNINEFKPGVKVEQLLDAFFEVSVLGEGPDANFVAVFGKAPEVMILHVDANEWNNDLGMYVKPKYRIIYGAKLNYEFSIKHNMNGTESVNVNVKYRLVSVVEHIGRVGGGHYNTYRMLGRKWYLTNDEQVKKVHFKYDVVPYIMVYERVSKEN